MSQQQPQRPSEPIKYGNVFDVSGHLSSQPITPQDAAVLQAAENAVLGETPMGGPASVMQSAANLNEHRGAVGHGDFTDVIGERGATVSETEVGGYRIITESIGGQVVGQYGQPVDVKMDEPTSGTTETDAITIGEALEATALSAGDKPIDQSDAAAIQAAEVRATGLGHVVPGGIGAEAQSAAVYNRTVPDEEKAKLGDVLIDATAKLASDKPATREDAEGVIYAEARNKEDLATHPGGVAESVAAAARLNQQK